MVADADAKAATLSPDAAQRLRDAVRGRVQSQYAPQAEELKGDIARYQALIDGTHAAPPRPYKDGP
jgi:hypothetical protein